MAKKITGPQILTANLLSDGQVVFLGPDGSWRADIETAQLAAGENEASSLEAMGAEAVRENLVVEPYLIEIAETDDGRVPVEFRERRRLAGPSVNLKYNSLRNGEAVLAA